MNKVKKSTLPTVSKRLVEILAIALAYVATAKLGFLVAIPPGNVTSVWPPSGLALAAALVFGYRSGLGIWLGSFSANIWFFTQSITLSAATAVLASSIATGSTLQALFAAFLIKRVVGTTRPERLFDVIKFLGIAAVSCLIASFWGVMTLVLAGLVSLGNYPYTWFTWWLGDLAGILIIAPPLIVLSHKKTRPPLLAQMAFPLVGFGAGFTLVAFFALWQIESQGSWPWGFLLAGLSFTALLSAYIEARKRAEASLREAQARLRLALQASTRACGIGTSRPTRSIFHRSGNISSAMRTMRFPIATRSGKHGCTPKTEPGHSMPCGRASKTRPPLMRWSSVSAIKTVLIAGYWRVPRCCKIPKATPTGCSAHIRTSPSARRLKTSSRARALRQAHWACESPLA